VVFLNKEKHMQILFINNDGSGFADQIQIAEGMTVEALFQQRVSHGRPQDYLIRVNRQPITAGYILQEGDRVSITPVKIEGATSRQIINVYYLPSSLQYGPPWEPDNVLTAA
jgi:sulfur carrier protein ThiS